MKVWWVLMASWLGRVSTSARAGLRDQREAQERLGLLNRPWEEKFLHWAWDGDTWVLHGHLTPPRSGRRRSVTTEGWCPGLRAASTATFD